MALNTAARRASAIGAGGFDFGFHLPSSGGIDSTNERQAVAYCYRAVVSDPPTGTADHRYFSRRRRVYASQIAAGNR